MNYILLSLLLLIFATSFKFSYFNLPGLLLVVSAFIFLLIEFFRKKIQKIPHTKNNSILFYTLVTVYILFMFFSGGIYEERPGASFTLLIFPLILFPLVLSYGFNIVQIKNLTRYRYILLLFFALFLRVVMLIASPNPRIDTFVILKEAPRAFISGSNPYTTQYSQVYQNIKPDYYSYWPASFLLEMPFVTLFSDPRILFVLADIGAAVVIYKSGGKTREAQIYSLIYLFRPNSNFIIEQSWLTPLAFFLLALSVLLIFWKKEPLAAIAWGLLVGLKPDYILAIPFLWALTKWSRKAVLFFTVTAAILVCPFLFSRYNEFISQTILLYLLPADKIPIPIHLSLNLNSLYFYITGKDVPFLLSGALFSILYGSILLRIRKIRIMQTVAAQNTVILGLIIAFFGFYLLFRQAFINYYYFVTGLIILYLSNSTKTQKS